jgi:hypothetical protein
MKNVAACGAVFRWIGNLFAVGFFPAPWGGSMMYCNRYVGGKPQRTIELFGNSLETSLREQFLNNNR